jgi:hypothetical protein
VATEIEIAAAVPTVAAWIGPSIQAGAIIVSALGVALMIRTNRSIARKRAILDLIVKEQTDSDMLEARKRFVALKQAGNLEGYATKESLASGLSGTKESDLGFPFAWACAIQWDAYRNILHHLRCRSHAA